jgi:hypothetical protein
MRTNGMSLHKLPLFIWAIFVTAILLLLALPVFSYIYLSYSNLFYIFTIICSLFLINKIEFCKKKKLDFIDYIIIFLVIGHILSLVFSIVNAYLIHNYPELESLITFMTEPVESNSNNSRVTQIIHNNGTWSDTIRTIFIYGTASLRYVAVRTGPGRAFVVVGAVGTELGTRFAQNAINNLNYVLEHYNN